MFEIVCQKRRISGIIHAKKTISAKIYRKKLFLNKLDCNVFKSL